MIIQCHMGPVICNKMVTRALPTPLGILQLYLWARHRAHLCALREAGKYALSCARDVFILSGYVWLLGGQSKNGVDVFWIPSDWKPSLTEVLGSPWILFLPKRQDKCFSPTMVSSDCFDFSLSVNMDSRIFYISTVTHLWQLLFLIHQILSHIWCPGFSLYLSCPGLKLLERLEGKSI